MRLGVVVVGLAVSGCIDLSGDLACENEYPTRARVQVPSSDGKRLIDPPVARDGGAVLDCSDIIFDIRLPRSECAKWCKSECSGPPDSCFVSPRCFVGPLDDSDFSVDGGLAQYVDCYWNVTPPQSGL